MYVCILVHAPVCKCMQWLKDNIMLHTSGTTLASSNCQPAIISSNLGKSVNEGSSRSNGSLGMSVGNCLVCPPSMFSTISQVWVLDYVSVVRR